MVLRLCDELQVPMSDRDAFLTSAGLAPACGGLDLCDADMDAARMAIDWMPARHAPFPAWALDRHWRILRLNRQGAAMPAPFGLGEGDSLIGR